MAGKVHIKDGTGSGYSAQVTEDHALLVTEQNRNGFQTPDEFLTRYKLFRGFLEDSGGSHDMNVNGSVTPVEFSVSSEPGKVLYIVMIRVLLNGTYFEMGTQDFRRFGTATVGGAALTNGITLQAIQSGVITNLFAEPITRTGDFFNYSDDYVNLYNAVGAQEDFLSFDFSFEQAIVLPESVDDRLIMTVNDDLSSIDLFQVAVRGWQEVA